MPVQVRDYQPADEQDWLRCRVLAFLGTAYFDDVMTAKTSPVIGAELVAVDDDIVVGVLDRSRGFRESDHYLHVYADHYVNAAEPAQAVGRRPGLEPIKVFLHATLGQEAEMRKKFRRVHVCRRFTRPIGGCG